MKTNHFILALQVGQRFIALLGDNRYPQQVDLLIEKIGIFPEGIIS
jgi:hypothetical protein